MAAQSGSAKVWFYLTATGVVPCTVSQGYTAYTSRTVNTPSTTDSGYTHVDVLILGNDETKYYGVPVGTTIGTVAVGNA